MRYTIILLCLLFSNGIFADTYLKATQAAMHDCQKASVQHNQFIATWETDTTWISYDLMIPQAGEIEVSVDQANLDTFGSVYQISLANQSLQAKAIGTGGWHDFKEDKIGKITIQRPGKYRLEMRTVKFQTRALMNFKGIRLAGPGAKDIIVFNKPSRKQYIKGAGTVFSIRPGFDSKLKTLNPTLDYEDISPDIPNFKVSGLDFFSDGRLAISTWDGAGSVYILENPKAAKADLRFKKYAEGLQEVLGLRIVEDKVYVVQKSEFTRLDDTDGDGVADEYVCISNKWPVSTNFHEFTFGPLYENGKFYIALAIAVRAGGGTIHPQKKDRGTIIEIDPQSGDYRVITAGLRTPNGLMMNSLGDMFVADNQGDYLPASKIMHVKEGAFYNHRYSPAHPFSKNEVTQPAVWLQQNEIGNSPTEGAFVPHGKYKDHLLSGDIHHGGLKRIYFDKVNGQYQSAVFRFTQGLRAGINRSVFSKDGMLYLGGLGAGGNWETPGQHRDGLMRVKLYQEDAFEMHAIRAKSDGLEIEFSQPVKREVAWNKDHYQLDQWTYKPTAGYGGPKIDLKRLEAEVGSISEDGKKVFLKIKGMAEKHIIYLRLSDVFTSEKGKKLYTGDAYYTLNEIPKDQPGLITSVPAGLKLVAAKIGKAKEHPGRTVYRTMCMSCHSDNGFELVGPSFQGLAGTMRTVIRNGKEIQVKADRAYLLKSIMKPAEDIAKGYQPIMPVFSANMTKKQIDDILDYMESLEGEAIEIAPLLTNKDKWKVTASHNQAGVTYMIDDKNEPRWASGAHMKAGMWVTVELPSSTLINGFEVDAYSSKRDYPRGYELFVSEDGNNWKMISKGEGKEALLEIKFPAVKAKYIKMQLTKDSEVYWSIHEMNIYRKL